MFTVKICVNTNFAWQDENICKVEIDNLLGNNRKINTLLSDSMIVSVRNVYKTNDNLEFSFTDEIIVKFKSDIEISTKQKLIDEFNLVGTKITKIYEVFCVSKYVDIADIANKLYESGNFEFAYPNIICKPELFVFPNDPYFQNQITCHNTGQTFNGHTGTPDADIDAPEAWNLTTGCSDIVIAVFDEGVTSDHPDLPNSRQIRLSGSNFGSGNVNDPSPTGDDNHGNACSGIIAATMNNNQGIAGIAPGSRIMPIRWDATTTSPEMADGIVFAVNNGATIISNSWGYGTDNNNFIPAIVSAIQYAINNNVVVIFAAGNTAKHNSCSDNGFVTFPANANVNSLITVGASDRYDNQADYSPTNSLIDIVAPSHKAYPTEAYSPLCGGISGETFEMWTIDIPGEDGYNSWPTSGIHPPSTGEELPGGGTNFLSYTGRFGGTSHACPVVAGVAALILSLNPDLTPQDVFNLLISTADKVGSYSYNNGRCDEMGFGRVNAYQAVLAASGGGITGNTLVCQSPNRTFTYNSRPSGTTIYWTKSSNLEYVSGQNTDNFTVRATGTGAGPGWVEASLNSACEGLRYPVWVGTPLVSITDQQTYEGCPDVPYWFKAQTVDPSHTDPFTYDWAIYPDNGYISNADGGLYAGYAYITFYEEYSVAGYDVKARASNACGTGAYGETNIYIHSCFDYMLSPNPASESVTVTIQKSYSDNCFSDRSVSDDAGEIYSVRIFDIYGSLIYASEASGDIFTIPVNNLKDGSYIVRITKDNKTINKQLVVQHQ